MPIVTIMIPMKYPDNEDWLRLSVEESVVFMDYHDAVAAKLISVLPPLKIVAAAPGHAVHALQAFIELKWDKDLPCVNAALSCATHALNEWYVEPPGVVHANMPPFTYVAAANHNLYVSQEDVKVYKTFFFAVDAMATATKFELNMNKRKRSEQGEAQAP